MGTPIYGQFVRGTGDARDLQLASKVEGQSCVTEP